MFLRIAKARAFVLGGFLLLSTGHLTPAQQKNGWTWLDKAGATHPGSELDDIVAKHVRWVASNERAGSYAILVGSDLNGANLPDAVLIDAQLSSVNLADGMLGGANLSGAVLRRAHLNGAFLIGANLTGAFLYDADLRGAIL